MLDRGVLISSIIYQWLALVYFTDLTQCNVCCVIKLQGEFASSY